MPTPDPASVHADCLDALVTTIQALSLQEITAIGTQEVVSDVGKVGSEAITDDDGNLAGSFISVSPWGIESIADFTNVREITTYRCLVAIIAKRDTPELTRKLEWREKIRKALQRLRIDVPTVRQTTLELNPVVDAQIWRNKAIYFSSFVVLCYSYEDRAP
ncbi:MAG: hypothetical protein JSS49_30075 [Planctomycetes bacterium]|nr:hypothetical protein [Planctomycetota bacterium]